jgi:UDP-GlcNAc:undecaprenyl-phosphate GlcNAc-1-phosphate transferase
MFDFLILVITLIFFFLIHKEIIKFKFIPIDKPDRIKKIHHKPTPLSGGIFICAYMILILIFCYMLKLENIYHLSIIVLLSFFSFCLGFYDDKFFLKPIYKLIINGIIIFFIIKNFSFLNISNINSLILKKNILLGFYSYFFTTLCFLLLINAFNMSDGINSLSVGIAIIWLLMIIFLIHFI